MDELIEVLLQKENRDFDSFCAVLEKHSYNAMGERLKEGGTLPIIAVLYSRCARPQSEVTICHVASQRGMYQHSFGFMASRTEAKV